jgi:transposase InsO family protein
MRILVVFIVLEHDRRKVLHFNMTEHPTGAWTAQQIVEAFADREAAPYLIRDRDSRYSAEVRLRIQSLGMQEILTAPQSPWQNPYAERLIGSIRRECSEPLHRPERSPSQANVVFLFPLLPRIENPLEPRQAMSVSSRGVEGWKDCRNSTTRRPSPPI